MGDVDIAHVTTIIAECRTLVSNYVYMVLVDRDKHQTIRKLQIIDENLNRLLLMLDASNLDRITRKTQILAIQEIQKAVDHICK